ncbi:MAG: ATP-binding protein [Kineosporiaceae bacterium]
MSTGPVPHREVLTRAIPDGFGILDAESGGRFDRLTRLARLCYQAPHARIGVLGPNRQWLDSGEGTPLSECGPARSLCQHTASADGPLVVPDAVSDPRFRDDPLVTGPPFVRFYLGVPLRGSVGEVRGVLCVMDPEPRTGSDVDPVPLDDLAHLAEVELLVDEPAILPRPRERGSEAILSDGLATVGEDGLLLDCNEAAATLTGYSRTEIIGRSVSLLLPGAVRADLCRRLHDLSRPGDGEDSRADRRLTTWALSEELPLQRRDGSTFPVEVTVTAFQRRLRLAYLVSMRDVSARKRAEEESAAALAAHRLANLELDRLSRLKTEFIAIVSHEFRTALTGIQAFSELIRDGNFPPAEVREFADDINADAVRLNRMITDLLSLERMESGKLPLTPEPIDLDALAAELVERSRTTFPEHTFTFIPGAPEQMSLDRDRMIQALANLLSNAAKYSTPDTEVEVRVHTDGGDVLLVVADRGVGIAAEELERVFDRYHRAENRSTKDVSGIGLGLPIVRQIARLHGGHAWAQPRPGGGTEFLIRIPTWGP